MSTRMIVIALLFLMAGNARTETQETPVITISNNFKFPVNQAIYIAPKTEWLGLVSDAQKADGAFGNVQNGETATVQMDSNGCWVHAELAPGTSATWSYDKGGSSQSSPDSNTNRTAVTETFPSGLPKSIRVNKDLTVRLFDLALVEITKGSEKFEQNPDAKRSALLENLDDPESSKTHFKLQEKENGPLVDILTYRGTIKRGNTYRVDATYQITPSGVDVQVELQTLTNKYKKGYLALAKFMPATEDEEASIRFKGEIRGLSWKGQSPKRTDRTHHWCRDASWLCLSGNGEKHGLLADFTPGLTRLIDKVYLPVNDFLVNELVLGTEKGWYMVSELSGDNVMKYVKDRFLIPQKDEIQKLRFRCINLKGSAEQINQDFIAWAGYRKTQADKNNVRIEMGVSHVEFGTSYFPHSTFLENFQYWKTEGMHGAKWWPSHQTAWQTAKWEIQRDMMIANAIGMKWIRIHHFDSIPYSKDIKYSEMKPAGDEQWLREYLDFMVETARETGMYIYLDLATSPEFAGEIAKKYGDVIRYYEIQNEILLRGVNTGYFPYWKAVQKEIKAASPASKVMLSNGPAFLGTYERLEDLGMNLNAVGQHTYIDRREVPKAFADYALSVGGYASRRNMMPVNSEINWRGITREPLKQQAEHFSEIFDNFLSQQSTPLVGQFHLQETFCVPADYRGAFRHYEPLHMDRTLKPQGLAYRDIIKKYSGSDEIVNNLQITLGKQNITPGQKVTVPVIFKNIGNQPIKVQTENILPDNLKLDGEAQAIFSLQPQETYTLTRQLTAKKELQPGYYHVFEKVTLSNRIFFGWGTLSYAHQPKLETNESILTGVKYVPDLQSLNSFDLSSVRTVVFGKDAPAAEVDWTIYIGESLRSATGADIQRWSDSDSEALELLKKGSVILVGSKKSNRFVSELNLSPMDKDIGSVQILENPYSKGHKIVLITGATENAIQKAASDFLFRYWRHAKDAITFRVGIESDMQEDEPEKDTPEKDAALEITVPTNLKIGKEARILVHQTSEPPGPAPGKQLWALSDKGEIFLGKTNKAGELLYTFENAGVYEITVKKNSETKETVVVE